MAISTDIEEQTEDNTSSEDLYEVDHKTWIAQKCTEMGFPVAGFAEDIYEDAVIIIPPLFRFDWGKRNPVIGRVLDVRRDYDRVINIVLQIEDGTQVAMTYGNTYPCYFALPEDSEGTFPPQ